MANHADILYGGGGGFQSQSSYILVISWSVGSSQQDIGGGQRSVADIVSVSYLSERRIHQCVADGSASIQGVGLVLIVAIILSLFLLSSLGRSSERLGLRDRVAIMFVWGGDWGDVMEAKDGDEGVGEFPRDEIARVDVRP